jgi:hypothetical protein
MISGLTACGPGNLEPLTSPSQPTSILFLIAPPTSLAINASATVSADVTNSSNSEIAWSVTCGSAGACGSFASGENSAGFNNTYIAPPAIPSGTTVTVTATLVGDSTKSISATITITPPLPIVVSFQGVPPGYLQINTTAQLSANIANDVSTNPQVKWTLTCGSSSCGSFNPTTTTSEASTTYTAPSTIPSGGTVTVTATSLTDPTKSVSANINIIPTAATLSGGTYVFHLDEPEGNAASFVSGVMVAQSGAITAGEQDFINYADNQNDQEYLPLFDPIVGGSYSTTPDGNLQIVLKTNDPAIGVETMNGVIVSSSRVLLTQLNGFIASGSLDLQTSTAAPSGGYAFSTSGVDLYGQPAGIGGILNVDSAGGISGNGSVVDINDNFAFSGEQSLAASKVTGPDRFGRVVFQLTPLTASAFPSFYLAGYVVDANRIRLVETAGDNFQGVMGGNLLSQGTNIGTFSTSSLAGSSYVFGMAGEDLKGSLQVAGILTATADGNLTGTLNWNDLTAKATQSPIIFTGSYSVDSDGRATLSNLTDGSTFTYDLEFYLSGSGEGLLLSGSTAQMIAGRALQQQTGTFSAASFSGVYGLSAAQISNSFSVYGADAVVGPITSVAGSGTDVLNGFVDFGNDATDFPVAGSITVDSNGIFTGTLSGLDAGSYKNSDNFTFFLIDNTRALMIETDTTQQTLGFLELQQ